MSEKEEYDNNILRDITLECLMKKKYYHQYKYKQSQNQEILFDKQRKKNIQFYKKRINDMTRYFMNHSTGEDRYYPEELSTSFYAYLDSAIEYFKMIDKTDIIQEDYIGLSLFEYDKEDEDTDDEDEEDDEEKEEEKKEKEEETKEPDYNKSLLFLKNKSNTTNTSSLFNNFIKITKQTSTNENLHYPHQKHIQLDNPKLKTKGIYYDKNNNITNNYEKEAYNKNTEEKISISKEEDTPVESENDNGRNEKIPDEFNPNTSVENEPV